MLAGPPSEEVAHPDCPGIRVQIPLLFPLTPPCASGRTNTHPDVAARRVAVRAEVRHPPAEQYRDRLNDHPAALETRPPNSSARLRRDKDFSSEFATAPSEIPSTSAISLYRRPSARN